MLSNPWVIGIIGGIISGLIVFFITTFLYNKISKKEYFNKVNQVNLEIISLLIMSVSEDKIPSLQIIQNLLNSVSRKYNVKVNDVNTIEATIEDLIKVIFETNFIPIDKKNELAEKLISLVENKGKDSEETKKEEKVHYTNSNLRLLLTLFSTVIAIGLLVVSLKSELFDSLDNILFNNEENLFIIVPITTATLSLVVAAMTYLTTKKELKDEAQLQEFVEKIKKISSRKGK